LNTKNLILFFLCTIITISTHTTEQCKELTQGILIAIEGIDGAGKTTLIKIVNTLLREEGFSTIITKEPGDTPVGKQIREILINQTTPMNYCTEYLLFAADRAQHFVEVIIPALQENKIVISDRLADSSLAYQGYGRHLSLEMIRTINAWAMNGRTPDITIFVHIPVKTALERCRKRSALIDAFEHEALLNDVAHGFEDIYKNRTDVFIVDGTKPREERSREVYTIIKQWIEDKQLIKHNIID